MNFDEKVAKLLYEDYEDKEDDIKDDDVDIDNDELNDLNDDDDDDYENNDDIDYLEVDAGAKRDWTNIPNAKKGRTLEDLKKVRKPLEDKVDEEGNVIEKGWTQEEVIIALKPTLKFAAKNYATPNFSKEEGILAGMEGVLNALRNDKGIANFATYAFRPITINVKRAAAGTRKAPTANVSGIKPNEKTKENPLGKTDFLKGSRATVSADAPLGGDSEGGGEKSLASMLSGDPTSGAQSAEDQIRNSKLLFALFMSPEIPFSKTERNIMRLTYGIDRDGKFARHGMRSTAMLAQSLGVSNVRISQIRKSALNKITAFMKEKGITNLEDAFREFGISNESKLLAAAMLVLESMRDILAVEMTLLGEHIDIPINVNLGGIVRHSVAKVNTNTMAIDDIIAEGNESILGRAGSSEIDSINNDARIMMSKSYFAETVNTIIQMHAQPILAVIDRFKKRDEED